MEFLSTVQVRDTNNELRKVARVENTDGDPGDTIFVGDVLPASTKQNGDVHIGGDDAAAGGPSSAPIVTEKFDADFTLSNTSGAWVDLESAGSAGARPLDVVIPGVQAGQWIEVTATGLYSNQAVLARLDMFTIVGGSPVNQISGNSSVGVMTWLGLQSEFSQISGGVSYQLQTGDIDGGSVRLRARYLSPGTKTIFAASAGYRLRFEGRGPFS